ncbi:hypothetical protein [Croceicoccus hydrothermalis]|uniref:hypothetical protein n=1 Tax=Croceicoccus hydrothermalis TaxID=2867964 RepID=UPI001EFBEE24|nr:hypothetical protein [Croceicoccus hydrothermalis]
MVDLTKHVRTRIRYDGPALIGHEMDVQELAPALLAMAEIVQIANRKFNGEAVAIRVMVDADVEQQCFQLDLSLVQSVLNQAATLLGHRDLATAKEIAEWIGIIGGSGLGLFALLKRIYGKGDTSPAVTFSTGDQTGTTIINIAGDAHGIVVPTETARLLVDQDVQKNVRGVLKPLEHDGYEDITFLHDEKPVTQIEKDEALAIRSAPPITPEEDQTESASKIRGAVRIKCPQYECGARWSLLYQGRAIDAEMDNQTAKWVAEFSSKPDIRAAKHRPRGQHDRNRAADCSWPRGQ